MKAPGTQHGARNNRQDQARHSQLLTDQDQVMEDCRRCSPDRRCVRL